MVAPRAILFDTGGTVLDWHGSLVNELRALGAGPLQAVDPSKFVNEWRRRSMRAIVGQVRPDFDMDDVHLRALDGVAKRGEHRRQVGGRKGQVVRVQQA